MTVADGDDNCRAKFVSETSATYSLAYDGDAFMSQKNEQRITTTPSSKNA